MDLHTASHPYQAEVMGISGPTPTKGKAKKRKQYDKESRSSLAAQPMPLVANETADSDSDTETKHGSEVVRACTWRDTASTCLTLLSC